MIYRNEERYGPTGEMYYDCHCRRMERWERMYNTVFCSRYSVPNRLQRSLSCSEQDTIPTMIHRSYYNRTFSIVRIPPYPPPSMLWAALLVWGTGALIGTQNYNLIGIGLTTLEERYSLFVCLMVFNAIFQLYRGGEFYWWRKPNDPKKTTDLSQVTAKL